MYGAMSDLLIFITMASDVGAASIGIFFGDSSSGIVWSAVVVLNRFLIKAFASTLSAAAA